MKDWIAISLLIALLLAVMFLIGKCSPEEEEDEDDEVPVEPIEEETWTLRHEKRPFRLYEPRPMPS